MLCRAGQNHRLSSAPSSIDALQEKDIEAILGIVCSDDSMPSIWGVRLQLLSISQLFESIKYSTVYASKNYHQGPYLSC